LAALATSFKRLKMMRRDCCLEEKRGTFEKE
jgi:hypothetical protein